MAATREAILGQLGGTSWATALPQVTPNGVGSQNLDILQIVDIKGENVLINVDYAGVVHNPASGNTNGTRCGQFRSTLSSGTTAAIFAATFTNPDNSDILQVVSPGGNVPVYIDYAGVSH
jgi:hypothetical protein